MLDNLRRRAQRLKQDTYALYLAGRDRRTPWYVRVLAGLVVAYALSPIDLIPDFIPVLGYLDDLIIVPAGLLLVARLIPSVVLQEAQVRARDASDRPTSRGVAVVVIGIWVLGMFLLWVVVARALHLV